MLSLDNVHNNKQLWAWLERVRKKLIASSSTTTTTADDDDTTKALLLSRNPSSMDCHCRCIIKNNNNSTQSARSLYKLQWAATRGDGRQGTDVTAAVQDIGDASSNRLPMQFIIE